MKTRNFNTTDGQLDMNHDCVRKCWWHPQVKAFVFWVQGEFSFDAHVHPTTVAGLQKHLGYLPGMVCCTWQMDNWKGVESHCTWLQIWDEVNQVHVTKITAGDRYGITLYVEDRFLELSGAKLSKNEVLA